MTTQPQLSCRAPVDIVEGIDNAAHATGRNRSKVILEALSEYLGRSPSDTMASQLKDLNARMVFLEQQLQGFRMLMGK